MPSLASARSSTSRSSIATINTTQPGGGAQTPSKLEELFSCFICFGTIQNAVMCPNCSKLACSSCLRKWLEETRAQCPHCRATLRPNQTVNCRFIADIMHTLQSQENQASARRKEKCPQHGTQLSYFCKTCKRPICSDCAMFGDQHKNHKFEKLDDVYTRHVSLIKGEAGALSRRLRDLKSNISEVQSSIEKVQKAK